MIEHKLLITNVWHRRLFPAHNAFHYRIYQVLLDMNALAMKTTRWWFGINRPGLVSFHDKDHGFRDQSSSLVWLKSLLSDYGVIGVEHVELLTMPRVLGYLFSPVSFWLCRNEQNDLIAVVAEVNNTFGETHSYICHHASLKKINRDEWLSAQKKFHVSPFMDIEGEYRFRFDIQAETIKIAIHYYCDGKLKLVTSINSLVKPLTGKSLLAQFVCHPLMTIKVIGLIHWQAIKLWFKKISYRRLPEQSHPKHSRSDTTEHEDKN